MVALNSRNIGAQRAIFGSTEYQKWPEDVLWDALILLRWPSTLDNWLNPPLKCVQQIDVRTMILYQKQFFYNSIKIRVYVMKLELVLCKTTID